MKKYKFDLHVHTSETSLCGKVSASKLVRLYKEHDYSGIVITDHYYKGFFGEGSKISWKEKIDKFLIGYNIAVNEGEKFGLNIYLGMELKFNNDKNDYLVYGIDEHFLYNNKNLYKMDIESFRNYIDCEKMLIFQAHPYRKMGKPAKAEYLDGIEVFNGNKRHDSGNQFAYEYAKTHKLRMISGSDFHRNEDIARGGILLNQIPKDNKSFVKILRKNKDIGLIKSDD